MMCLFKPNTYDPKDWQCPKPSCRTINFKKRLTCISCGARKPDGSHQPLYDWREGEKEAMQAWDCDQCGTHNEVGSFYCMQCKKPSQEMHRLMEEEKARRQQEEGRGGGLYDRQDPNDKQKWDSDGEEFDDFGRRKKKRKAAADAGGAQTTSARGSAAPLADKHKAALERLQRKHAAGKDSAGDGGTNGDRSRGRSRSRSRRRR